MSNRSQKDRRSSFFFQNIEKIISKISRTILYLFFCKKKKKKKQERTKETYFFPVSSLSDGLHLSKNQDRGEVSAIHVTSS